jgi:hypothetical protein
MKNSSASKTSMRSSITALDSYLAMSTALLATLLGIEVADDFLYVVHGKSSRHDEKINRALEHA